MLDDAGADESALVAALRAGDEAAFAALVDRNHRWLLRLARRYVRSEADALEVVQETWLAVVAGIDRFEGRSTLRTWIGRIAMNRGRSRGVREARSVPFASVVSGDDPGGFDPDQFVHGPRFTVGAWSRPPLDWSTLPEGRLEAAEVRGRVRELIDGLPEQQATVILLRDVEGWSPAEVCDLLEITEGNQRVLLHRARSVVRRGLGEYLGGRT